MVISECANSKECHSYKHHYDECVERVTNASDDDAEGEDCVEECKHYSFSSAVAGGFPRKKNAILSPVHRQP